MNKIIEYFINKYKLSDYFIEKKYKKIEPNLDWDVLYELKSFERSRFKNKNGDYFVFYGKFPDKIINFLENNENVKVFVYNYTKTNYCYISIAWGDAIKPQYERFKKYKKIHNKIINKTKKPIINKYPINLMLTNCK